MKVDVLTIRALFQKDVRYEIPNFQRPYVWNQEDQWEPLWNDVRNAAERYLDGLAELGEEAAAEEQAGAHFLGAVVVQQQPTTAIQIETRHVIDGQQRLTTLQILLDAAQEVLERLGQSRQARRLSRLVLNDEDYAENNPDHAYKIWPTNVDQEAFRRAMTNGAPTEGFEDALIVQAHQFFQLQIQQWIDDGALVDMNSRVQALETALMGLLEVVVIDLEQADDTNVIFETLNARGTPLLASDLIKNLILHMATESNADPDRLYEDYWRSFDEPWWREEIRQGRLSRPRIDVFLNYWLVMRTADEVASHDVFRIFRAYCEQAGASVEKIVADIHSVGDVYRGLELLERPTRERIFLRRWQRMDVGVVTPLLLWLFTSDDLSEERLVGSLQALESFMVPRMVCRMTTKDYNRLFLDLLSSLNSSDAGVADQTIIEFLSQQDSESRLWPDDRRLGEAFRTLPIYRLLTRGRLRMVLEGIEEELRSTKAEEDRVTPDALTIEHLMPQSWQEHWPLEVGGGDDQLDAIEKRERLIHSIGNLTLVNDKLNPALSNAPWKTKQAELRKHSVLHLNKMLVGDSTPTWDESSIGQRADQLLGVVAAIWPDAQGITSPVA